MYTKRFYIFILVLNVFFVSYAQNPNAQQELEKSFFYGARTSNIEILNEFIKTGINVNYQGENGYTAIMIAAYNGQKKAVEFLHSKGADLCIKDKRNNTALMGAIVAGEDDIAKFIISNEKCDEETNKRTLEYAQRFGRTEIIKFLSTKI
ncbi:ankyrin repeat domain-containing protein [Flavobacterium davisii]|uniref:Ankyrin repeat domain-containing protein n=1 Tax=Flavobacterium columnare TaxID=996 RepID=A0A8G0KXG0_9FLAO|nr:ankyrin repeat domain-containing protein [Flavobacterium davisii]QYS89000.1 ankyrin repeat domain-containing protein [Flavobacterium davisii]